MRLLPAVLAVVGAWTMSEAATAGPPYPLKPKLEFDESSPYAMIVFEAGPQTITQDWNIKVYAFDPETRAWKYSPLKGWAIFTKIRAQPEGTSFHAALVSPVGTYAVSSLSTQGFWSACFNGGTKAFQSQAGKVNYVGLLDPQPVLEKIFSELPDKTQQKQLFLFDMPRLALTAPAQRENWEADVATFIKERFPKVTAPIVAAEPMEATFEPGKSMLAGKICEKY
jgi:hypothetical protein